MSDHRFDVARRSLLAGGALLGASVSADRAEAVPQWPAPTADGRTDTEPRVYAGRPMPEPPPERSAGPVTGAEYEVTGGDSAKSA